VHALVKLYSLRGSEKFEKYGGDMLAYFNTVANTNAVLPVGRHAVKLAALELAKRRCYGDVIELYDYLLVDKAINKEPVMYQAFYFYLNEMGDVSRAEELLAELQKSGINENVLALAEVDFNLSKDRVKRYNGELRKSGVFALGSGAMGKQNERQSLIPEKFALHTAYPNPFNPATTISFDIPQISNVTVTVFNVLGQRVATLVNELLPGGNHSRIWDASRFGSGIYFVKMESGTFTETRKITLMK
jgi:hypothetical protein